jgi:3-dehydroquinate synthase
MKHSSPITKLSVDLGPRSYPIHIGPGLRRRRDLLAAGLRGKQVLIVSDSTVAPLYLDELTATLDGYQVESLVFPDGEASKTLGTVQAVFDKLIDVRFERSATLLALGGGVVGDIAGFAAACYQRGVHVLQVPTTLLAQVDSSVGGKTGVNHPRGKNLIGAFHQPTAVLIDTETLDTLDARQFRAGLAEVIKYGLIRDADFFDWLEVRMDRLLERDPDTLRESIARSCRNKAEVVHADEFEAGQRALLNLGHTFGHALEAGTGYGRWLHGEAVAIGSVLAAELSLRSGWLAQGEYERIVALFEAAGLPTAPPVGMTLATWQSLMALDKKVSGGKLRLVLLEGLGRAIVSDDFDAGLLRVVLERAAVGSAAHAVPAAADP